MKILVTGGAGFMGSNFIRYILEKYPDYQIINLDKLTYAGNLENLKDIEDNPNYKFIKGDIADKVLLNKIFTDNIFEAKIGEATVKTPPISAIINYAAETHVDRSIIEPDAFIKTDVLGTYNLLETARKFGLEKYIQISTDEVYGSIEKGEFTENSPFEPNSPYSAAKAGADHLCRAYFQTYGLPTIVTHSCNFFGPYQYPEKLIPLFITNLLEDKNIPLYGRGEQVREWIFTQDHCRAIDLILHQGREGEVYNIGTGQRKENIEVARLILNLLAKDESYIEYVKDRPGHDFRYAVNADKLKENLGWQPKIGFEQGLQETIAWYKKNQAWWQNIKSGDYLEYYKKQYEA